MAALLAAISALTFGAGDFLGGLSARRITALATTAIGQATGLVLAVGGAVLVAGAPTDADLLWGASAGIGSGGGILLFYWALTEGSMSVVAPVSAAVSAVIPVVVGLALGERPGVTGLIGVVLSLPAVVLIARQPRERDPAPDQKRANTRVLAATVGAGVLFGWPLVAFSRLGEDSGLWPLVGTRTVSAGLLVTLALVTGAVRRVRALAGARPGVLLAVASGSLESFAFVGQLLATRTGLLSLVAVISAMYPASTVVLARVVLREVLVPHQVLGLVTAGVAVALLALG